MGVCGSMVEPIRIKDQFSLISGIKSIKDDTNIVAGDDDGDDDSDIAADSDDVDDDLEHVDDEGLADREKYNEEDDDLVTTEIEIEEVTGKVAESAETGLPSSSTKHPFKYVCPFCGKRYTSRSGLLSHKNTVHYQVNSQLLKDKTFSIFKNRRASEQVIIMYHFQRKPYRCQKCNEHFFTSASRVAHIHREHAGKGEDITDTYSRKDTVMRKKALAEEGEEAQAPAAPQQKKRTVVLMPRPPPPLTQQQQDQPKQAAAVPKAFVKSIRNPESPPREIVPRPPLPKFVVLPAQKPYPIVEKSRNSLPNTTYSRNPLQENVCKLCSFIGPLINEFFAFFSPVKSPSAKSPHSTPHSTPRSSILLHHRQSHQISSSAKPATKPASSASAYPRRATPSRHGTLFRRGRT